MLEKLHGIVLKSVKFSDTKMIVHLFTEGYGRMSFVTPISHSRTSRSKMAFWSPLSQVEFTADIRLASSQLPKPKDVRLYNNYTDIPFNHLKLSVSMFVAEFLTAILRSESVNVPLYRFIETSLLWFDQMSAPTDIANFHLVFLLRLTRFVGIFPNLELPHKPSSVMMPIFDLLSAEYRYDLPPHKYYLSPEESALLPLFERLDYSTMHLLRLTRTQRNRFLEVLELYYRLHLPSFADIKSMQVLQEVFA